MENEPTQKNYALPASILIAAAMISATWMYTKNSPRPLADGGSSPIQPQTQVAASALEEKIFPSDGVELPVVWGDLGAKMASVGVIDAARFEALYADRGGATEEMKQLLYGENNGNLKITEENSGMILNLLWALGLGTKNAILEQGPMTDKRYNGAGTFASTGGWTIAQGNAMDHYSRHPFVMLTLEQQAMVERVAKNIYRPCCGNSTYFPDCNHGMAMLGLLELAASQDVSEADMYKIALQVNAYWFPDAYLAIAEYFKLKKIEWEKADPKELLGYNFSSAAGFKKIASQLDAHSTPASGGCGVEPASSVPSPRGGSGCGI